MGAQPIPQPNYLIQIVEKIVEKKTDVNWTISLPSRFITFLTIAYLLCILRYIS